LLLAKLQEEENNVILQMRKDFMIIQKKSNIHEREIKRIQSLVTKYANFRGHFLGELKREKTRNRQQNDIITISKKVDSMKMVYSPEIRGKDKKLSTEKKSKNKFLMNSPNNLMKKCKLLLIYIFLFFLS